jgi:drug/metabolite transporter (DMT)-like permease
VTSPENRTRGILWMLATMICFIALDALMKLGLAHFSLLQVTWGRFFFATVFAVLWCGRDLPQRAISKVPKQQTLRSVFLTTTTVLFSCGIIFLPLPTATTIMFLSPILTTMLSVLVLGEHVGPRRWAGVALGFAGAIIVVQPWMVFSGTFNLGLLFMLAAALTNSAYQIVTRKVRGDDAKTSLLFTAAFGAVVTSAALPFYWITPDAKGWALLAGSGLAGALGHFCIIHAYRNAPASVVAPFSYTALIWATLLGYLIWNDFPARNVWAGAALIIASGLYIFWRETVRQVEPARPI